MPNWTENLYIINGQRLKSMPYSWGAVNESGDHLYYIDRNELSDLSQNSDFLGFFADDIVVMPWADKIFEVVVEDVDSIGNVIEPRIKRSQINGRKIISEINSETKKYYHPQQFGTSSPWNVKL